MNCGFELQTPDAAMLEDLLSLFGLGGKLEDKGTPLTVGLEQDEKSADDAILSATKKLTYGSWFASGNDSPVKKSLVKDCCNPEHCRMTSGMCVDCGKCQQCCTCDADTVELLEKVNSCAKSEDYPSHRFSTQTKESSIAGNSRSTKVKQSAPQHQSQHQSEGNSLRYNMGDEGEYLHLTHRMLKEHTNRTKRADSSSYHSYASYNSSNTGSSRRRYNFGGDDDLDYNCNQQRTTRRGHRRTASNGSNISDSSNRKSNNSFSLRLGKKNNSTNHSQKVNRSSSKSSNAMDDPIIGKTFSFDSNPSRGSAYESVDSSDLTRRSATSRRSSASRRSRTNSHTGSSLSSSSRSYLEDGIVIETESKKSWFRRRFESRE